MSDARSSNNRDILPDSWWRRYARDPRVQQFYHAKIEVIQLIRQYFLQRGFQELEAPLLSGTLIPESYVDVLSCAVRRRTGTATLHQQAFLPTSPEAFCKKMMAAGVKDNFCITKVFRNNEPFSKSHATEFTMLEWYETAKDYRALMDSTQALVQYIAKRLSPLTPHQRQDWVQDWHRVSVAAVLKQAAGIDLAATWNSNRGQFDLTLLRQQAEKAGDIPSFETWSELFDYLFLTYAEPELPQDTPVIIYDYPCTITPLAKHRSPWAERFELFFNGLELCDGYTEETNYEKVKSLLEKEQREIENTPEKVQYPMDQEFLRALKKGIPESAGNALGVDRLTMALLGLPQLP